MTGAPRMLRTIQAAEPLPECRVRLVWGDGAASVVDLGQVPTKGGVFGFLADPAAFERANYVRTLHSWSSPSN